MALDSLSTLQDADAKTACASLTRALLSEWETFAAQTPLVDLRVAGSVDCHGQVLPIIGLHVEGGPKRALLVSGIHGEEPAGPEALKRFFLGRSFEALLGRWTFDVLPLASPCGHVAGTRSTPRCEDPNREFPGTGACDETAILAGFVEGGRWDLLISLHEDCDADGIYLYDSGTRDRQDFLSALGESTRWLSECEAAGFAVSSVPFIDGSVNHGGIIVGSDTDFPAFEPTMYRTGRTDRAVVIETPTRWRMKERIGIHLSALGHYLGPGG